MRRIAIVAAVSLLWCSARVARAQSLDDLNIQIHGYATQGFLYTTQNNIFATESSNGSPAWTEAVVNIGAQPESKLRIGVQGRYFLLGSFGNDITLDWAAVDYKAGEQYGFRFGKVKTPSGLFNEIQDIDPSYMWSLLPQSVYPITSRNSVLAHYGGVMYGTVAAGPLGKLEYRGWGGEREIGPNDGYWVTFREEGIALTNGVSGVTYGGALHWRMPVQGLMVGASLVWDPAWSGAFTDTYVVPAGPSEGVTITTPGTLMLGKLHEPDYFGKYEKNRVMVAAEWERIPTTLTMAGLSPVPEPVDERNWFAMTSYKLTNKLSTGLYDSQSFDVRYALGPSRFSKDWGLSGRYDFNEYLYAKAEQHWIDGTSIGYDTDSNPNGLKPESRLTILKIGVSF